MTLLYVPVMVVGDRVAFVVRRNYSINYSFYSVGAPSCPV